MTRTLTISRKNLAALTDAEGWASVRRLDLRPAELRRVASDAVVFALMAVLASGGVPCEIVSTTPTHVTVSLPNDLTMGDWSAAEVIAGMLAVDAIPHQPPRRLSEDRPMRLCLLDLIHAGLVPDTESLAERVRSVPGWQWPTRFWA